MGGQGRDAHGDQRPLGGRHRADRGQELIRPRPVHHPQHRLAARREPDGPQPPVLLLAPSLDQAPPHEAVDQPRRRRRRPPDRLGEVRDGRRPAVRQHVQRGELGEPEAQLAELGREPDDQLPPQRAAHRHPLGDLAHVVDPGPGRQDRRGEVRLERAGDDPRLGAARRRTRTSASGSAGPAAGSVRRGRRRPPDDGGGGVGADGGRGCRSRADPHGTRVWTRRDSCNRARTSAGVRAARRYAWGR